MQHTPPTCHCGRSTSPTMAPAVEVEVDAARLRLDGLGVWRCDAGHVTVADDALAQRVLGEVDERLVVSTHRRLRRDDACGDCGAALVLPGRGTEVPVPLSTPFGVVTPTLLTMFVRCPDCGTDQLPHDARAALPSLLDAAITHALDQAVSP